MMSHPNDKMQRERAICSRARRSEAATMVDNFISSKTGEQGFKTPHKWAEQLRDSRTLVMTVRKMTHKQKKPYI
jgi:hypothetical protein